jgi:hydroxyacylglutathione hydrolase
MKIIQVYINNNLRNFNYILYSEITNDAIFFDPTDISISMPFAEKLELKPKYLLNTHQHYDHIADNEKFLALDGTQNLSLKDGEEFFLSPHEKIVCKFTPGHVMDHFCYFMYESEKLVGVIVGDTVFNAGVGNCKNGGDPRVLGETIKDFFVDLEDDVIIYPSHDYFLNNLNFAKTIEPDNVSIDKYIKICEAQSLNDEFMLTTIGEEKLFNPFFRVFDSKKTDKPETDINKFILLRSKRDKW